MILALRNAVGNEVMLQEIQVRTATTADADRVLAADPVDGPGLVSGRMLTEVEGPESSRPLAGVHLAIFRDELEAAIRSQPAGRAGAVLSVLN